MPGLPIEGSGEHDYPSDMAAGVRALEGIAASTRTALAGIRADQRAIRAEISSNAAALRADMTSMDQRRERDFRITFGAIITTTLGLAYLIAHTAHWL